MGSQVDRAASPTSPGTGEVDHARWRRPRPRCQPRPRRPQPRRRVRTRCRSTSSTHPTSAEKRLDHPTHRGWTRHGPPVDRHRCRQIGPGIAGDDVPGGAGEDSSASSTPVMTPAMPKSANAADTGDELIGVLRVPDADVATNGPPDTVLAARRRSGHRQGPFHTRVDASVRSTSHPSRRLHLAHDVGERGDGRCDLDVAMSSRIEFVPQSIAATRVTGHPRGLLTGSPDAGCSTEGCAAVASAPLGRACAGPGRPFPPAREHLQASSPNADARSGEGCRRARRHSTRVGMPPADTPATRTSASSERRR